MKFMEVLNVGQGDCVLINPTECCGNKNYRIFVDLGTGSRDITKEINPQDRVTIFLTHHHSDHIGGLPYFFNSFERIERIVLPFYANEVNLIANAILHLKGIHATSHCEELFQNFSNLNNHHALLVAMQNAKTHLIDFAFEGRRFCGNITALNPPLFVHSQNKNKLHNENKEEIERICERYFEHDYAEKLIGYFHSKHNAQDNPFSNDFLKMESDFNSEEIYSQKKTFVRNFFEEHIRAFRRFVVFPSRRNLEKIYSDFKATTHDVCTVLSIKHKEKVFLLTGDASKQVFYRLMRDQEKLLRAHYLKVPHHGSKNNLNAKILDHIEPQVAIISHDNRRFGHASDSLPNEQIIRLLRSRNLLFIVTNDVVKYGAHEIRKADNKKDDFVEVL